MAMVDMVKVRKVFGASVALEDFSLQINAGELVCLLGPSGCGKTTALRVLAGFEKADAGQVLVEGDDITSVPTERRNFGMVFQDYSLFPNMTTRQNIEFGLRIKGLSSTQRSEILDRMIAITALEDQIDKYPHQMSGGQKQRVALARAIATSPRLLLLDEPLSALDAKVRESLRDEIRHLQREIGVTTVFVTHDQHEALAIADRVGVMSQGRLEQLADPRELYERPANAFVAGFIGSINRVDAIGESDGRWRVLGRCVTGQRRGSAGEQNIAAIRPEQIALDVDDSPRGPASTAVTLVSFLGPITRVTINDLAHGTIIADIMSGDAHGLSPGVQVRLRLRDDVTETLLMKD